MHFCLVFLPPVSDFLHTYRGIVYNTKTNFKELGDLRPKTHLIKMYWDDG